MGSDNYQDLFPPHDHALSSVIESDTMTFPPLQQQSLSPSPKQSIDGFETQFEFKAGVKTEPQSTAAGCESSPVAAPKPLESLHETPIPPFLSKTYDIVDDPKLDYIISWGEKGNSFVVWEPVEFARIILPRNFKHNNFSSFVRQLNTYGFRKIDTDKWEFANEGFVRAQRHLLKKIQRRRSHQFQQIGSSSGSSNEACKAALEGELRDLRKERSLMMQEVVELQHQQHGTIQHIESVKDKLEAAERGQKQMVSFLVRMFENPSFLTRLSRLRGRKGITSPRTTRKFVKHQPHGPGTSSPSPKGDIAKYRPEHCNSALPCVTSDCDPAAFEQLPAHSFQFTGDGPLVGAEHMPSQVEDGAQDELAMLNELLHTPEKGESLPKLEATDPLLEQKVVANPRSLSANENFISPPNDLEKSIPEFSIAEPESMITEDVWRMGFEAGGAGMSSSTTEPWGCVNYYNVPDLGVSGGLRGDTWEIGSLQPAGSSGIERWLDEDSTFN